MAQAGTSSVKELTGEQALQVLIEATALVTGTRAQHELILRALETLRGKLNGENGSTPGRD